MLQMVRWSCQGFLLLTILLAQESLAFIFFKHYGYHMDRLAKDDGLIHTPVAVHSSRNPDDNDMVKPETMNVQTWNPFRLLVLRVGFTEPMGTSPLNYGKYDGIFQCAYCGAPLFDSSAKYDSGSGWPSFWRSATEDSIAYRVEFDGRMECRCKNCSR